MTGSLYPMEADVTGHGIGSALLAAVCRAYARNSFSVEENLLPAMERINKQLAGDLTNGLFVTFVAAIFSEGQPRVKLLSAGHGPLFFYVMRDDRFDEKGAQGLPLGIYPSFQSEPELNIDLQTGDLIVLTIDGFFEWANAVDERFGIENAAIHPRESPSSSGGNYFCGVPGRARLFGRTKQQDDLTAVIIKRTSLPV
jgi:serine phosphatase RsbU (regulator of sigma subunit)